MKTNIVKIRDYKNNKSLGVSSEIVEDMKKRGHEFFVRRYSNNGILTFTPLEIIQDIAIEYVEEAANLNPEPQTKCTKCGGIHRNPDYCPECGEPVEVLRALSNGGSGKAKKEFFLKALADIEKR